MKPEQLHGQDALFLDFDGTLVEIAEHPAAICVPAWLPQLLSCLQRRLRGALAVVSGRPLAELDHWLQPFASAAAGLHGAELRRAAGAPIERTLRIDLSGTAAQLAPAVAGMPGVWLEDKGSALALHFRAAPQFEQACLALARSVASESGLQVLRGRMVVELKSAAADKGSAVQRLMLEPVFVSRRPVFIGDDITDEDGFAAVHRLSGRSIRVGPGPSIARFRLANVPATLDFLTRALAEEAS